MVLKKIILLKPVLGIILGFAIGRIYETTLDFNEWICFTLFIGWPIACLLAVSYYVFKAGNIEKREDFV